MTEAEPHRAARRPTLASQLVTVLIVAGLVAVLGWNAEYVHDDHPAVLDNANVTWPPPVAQTFRTSYFGPGKAFAHMPLSRPLVTLSFAAEEGLGWTSSRARHLVSAAIYALICVLVGGVFGHMATFWASASTLRWHAWGTISATIFCLHPVHGSALMSVAYRPELMALGFILLASLFWLQLLQGASHPWLRTLAGVSCFGLALLCKESAVCALAPWLVAAWIRPGGLRRSAAMAAACVLLTVALLGWRHLVLGGVLVAQIPWADNPLSIVDGPTRIIGALEGIWLAATHLLVPLTILQAPDWSFDALQVSSTPGPRAIAGMCITVAAAAAAIWGLTGARRRGRAGLVALGLVWAAAFYFPVSNLLFPIPVRFAERLLFAPSVAACALLAWPAALAQGRFDRAFDRLHQAGWSRWRLWPLRLLEPHLVICLLLLSQMVAAAGPWRSDQSLFAWGVAQQPRSAKMRYNLGRLLVEKKRETEALPHLQIAVALRPDDHDARITLLEAHFRLKQCDQSRALADAMEADPTLTPLGHVALFHWAGVCRDVERMRRHEPWLRKRARGPPTKTVKKP